MESARNIHFVGSLGMPDAETAFRTLAGSVGGGAKRYPDGEPGPRSQWIVYQGAMFADDPNFEQGGMRTVYVGGEPVERPYFRLKDSVDAGSVKLTLGYAGEAKKSYGIFRALKEDGVIPAATRFQVCLPTPAAVLTGFIDPEKRAETEPPYKRAMLAEVHEITQAIPHEQLAIQWDIATEIIVHDGGYGGRLFYDNIYNGTLSRVAELSEHVPEPIELGIHLCYGDPGHKHVIEPADLATSVTFANGLVRSITRPVHYIHMPVPKSRDDAAYFAPLKGLDLPPETELILGLVHHTGGLAETRKRLRRAAEVVEDFGIATECGFGRRAPDTIADLLQIHRNAATS